MNTTKLLILDRDGTINVDSDEYIKSPAEWSAIPGSLEAIARLNHAGWHVVVVTNQSGLGRGVFEVSDLNAIHSLMHHKLAEHGGRIDAVFYCPHTPDDACQCRKPQPGLLQAVAQRYGVALEGIPVVGDHLRDLVAATSVGCEPHLVLTGKGAPYKGRPLPETFPSNTRVHEDLAAFADFLIAREDAALAAQADLSAARK